MFDNQWKKSYHSSHFAPAFLFLSTERRKALSVLYAVCRVLDDAVDTETKNPEAFLSAWKEVFTKKEVTPVTPFGQQRLAQEFLLAVDTYDIPLYAMVDLIEKGVAVDLKQSRFQTPLDTEGYCYGVAGTVGLACLPIFGVPVAEAKEFAVRLGIMIQWINTIRDVAVDAKMGRIYIPLDHLEKFGYTEEDVFEAKTSEKLKPLLQFEVQVAHSHHKRALELMPIRWKKQLLPARIMGDIYLALLKKIEKEGFPVFERKIKLNLFEKGLTTLKTIRN